jgi:diguanylate cyclase (GGDEF)-like protein/PAS domain S-box-containing protein
LNVKESVSGENDTDFQFLAEHSVDIICRVGLDLVMHYASPSTFRVLGWKPEEMIGNVAKDFIIADDMPALTAAIVRILSPGVQTDSATVRMRKKDGSMAWMEMNARLVRDCSTGEPREFVTVMRDITERKILEKRLSTLSLTDGLTGLSNRRAFDEALDREWTRTWREGSQISLLLLDIDHFKEFNDQYGHQVGDDCLRAVAASLEGAVGATDILARYGGEEIAVILPSTDTAGAVEVAEKMRSAIEALRLTHEGRPEGGGHVTASIGAATALARQGGTISSPKSLLLAADTAMYKAKTGGRNRVATALVVAPKTT